MKKLEMLICLHLVSVIFVIHSLLHNSWAIKYSILNRIFNLEITINENDILKIWLMAIQCRYLLTDIMSLQIQNNTLRKYTYTTSDINMLLIRRYSTYHCMEGLICLIIFYYYEKYTFSIICFIWTLLWSIGLFSQNTYII